MNRIRDWDEKLRMRKPSGSITELPFEINWFDRSSGWVGLFRYSYAPKNTF